MMMIDYSLIIHSSLILSLPTQNLPVSHVFSSSLRLPTVHCRAPLALHSKTADKLQALGQCIPLPRHGLPVLRYGSRSGSPPII